MWPGLGLKGVREKRWLRSAGGVIDETPPAALVATHDLPVDQARAHLEVGHGLGYEQEPKDLSNIRLIRFAIGMSLWKRSSFILSGERAAIATNSEPHNLAQ
jgi:hypothetical protein